MFFFVIYQKYLDKSSINILKTKVMICDICSMTFRKATQVKDTFQYRHDYHLVSFNIDIY